MSLIFVIYHINALSDVLKPLAEVEAVGEIYGVDFNIEANNYHSTGILNFEYDGLTVKVLNTETSGLQYFVKAILLQIKGFFRIQFIWKEMLINQF